VCQSPAAKHIVGVVAEEPSGMQRDRRSVFEWMKYGSLPDTTFAPPER
jgi:hypothetical protein